MKLRNVLLAVGLSTMTVSLHAQTLLVGATVFEGTGGPAIDDAAIRIKGDRIDCIGRRAECPPGVDDRTMDLTGQFITPGLIDAHVHFSQTGWLDGRPHFPWVKDFYDYEALQAGLKESQDRWHRAYLCSGITAVFDPGGMPWTTGYEKAAEGNPKRVHYRASGPLITHAQVTDLRALGGDTFLPMGTDGEAARSVEQLVDLGARAIKVWYLDPPLERREELDARLIRIGALAREAGLPLVVHATELRNAKQALRAGAAMLVHSVDDAPVDEEFIELARETDVIYAPTLQVGGNWGRALSSVAIGQSITPDDPNGCIDAETRRVIADAPKLHDLAPDSMTRPEYAFERQERAGREQAVMLANLKTVFDAGIMVATATDAGNPLTFHGPAIYREMEMMEQAGIPPLDIITLSTRNGAKVMRMDQIGTLESGKIADLIVLSENPSKSASAFRSVHHVMHLGAYFPVDSLAAKTAEP